jgi:hypothetical protein
MRLTKKHVGNFSGEKFHMYLLRKSEMRINGVIHKAFRMMSFDDRR